MAYFVFDLDETLAELYNMYYFIGSLRIKETLGDPTTSVTSSLQNSLNKAYNIFVHNILAEEISSSPIGIIRPGILGVMQKLYELQTSGIIKYVVIYSNNEHLQSLEFIRDIIHKYLGINDLIIDCIHWNHSIRDNDKIKNKKTWNTLKNIIKYGMCKESERIKQKNIYFFDDLEHKNLQKVLGSNYYKVPEYTYIPSFNRISKIFKNAIEQAEVDVHMFTSVISILTNNSRIDNHMVLDEIIELFKESDVHININVPEPDNGINMMMNAITAAIHQSDVKYTAHNAHNAHNVQNAQKRGGNKTSVCNTKKRRYRANSIKQKN